MTHEEVEKKVLEIVYHQFGVSEVKPEQHFINDLNADSLDSVEVVMELEDQFGISISDEEMESAMTVGAAVNMVWEKVQAREAA